MVEKFDFIDDTDLDSVFGTVEAGIHEILEKSDTVYVFRSLLDYTDRIPLIEWLSSQNIEVVDKIVVNYKDHDFVANITGEGEPIYKLELNDSNREKFISMFHIFISGGVKFQRPDDPIFVDNPLYQQYDYIFVKDGEPLLITFIHEHDFTYNKGMQCRTKK